MATVLDTAFNTGAVFAIIALSIEVALLVKDTYRRWFVNAFTGFGITGLIDRTLHQMVRALIADARILRAKIAVITVGICLATYADIKQHAGSAAYAGLTGVAIVVRLTDLTPCNNQQE